MLQSMLATHGLALRGGFVPDASDALPQLPDGRAPAVVWLVGMAGSGFWPHFTASTFYQDGLPDPLDRWSAQIGHALAQQHGGLALFPFDGPPYLPFQRWADRCEPTTPSPMMLRMHPRYGLWHAYRFALALPDLLAEDAAALREPASAQATTDICARCSGQPCLQACPVGAYTGAGFRIEACSGHVHSQPEGTCMQQGCLARRACPEGSGYRYQPEHAAFHMRAFADKH